MSAIYLKKYSTYKSLHSAKIYLLFYQIDEQEEWCFEKNHDFVELPAM